MSYKNNLNVNSKSFSAGRMRAYSSQDFLALQSIKNPKPQHFLQNESIQNKLSSGMADALSPPKLTDSQPNEMNSQQEIEIHPNKKTSLIFQFLNKPEYIGLGNNIIINMDYLKAFGKITQIIPDKIDETRGSSSQAGGGDQHSKHAKNSSNSPENNN